MVSMAASDPFARFAASLPAARWRLLSLGSRVGGVVALLGYAAANDYRPGRVFAFLLAALVAATLAPWPGRLRFAGAGLGGGLLLFTGAVLAHDGFGVLVLVAGLVAWVAALAASATRRGATLATLGAAFLGAPGTALLVAFVALTIEG